MLRTIHLHGRLGKKFAKTYQFDCATPAEAFRALIYQVPGFREELEQGEYRVRAVRKGRSTDFSAEMLQLELQDADLHVTPLVAGRKNQGGVKAVIGIIIIAVAIIYTGGTIIGAGGLAAPAAGGGFTLTGAGMVAAFGASLVLSGIAMMLAPVPKMKGAEKDEDRLFNGVENTYEQGVPVPLIYGQHLAGSVVVSAGIAAEDLRASTGDPFTDWLGNLLDDVVRYEP